MLMSAEVGGSADRRCSLVWPETNIQRRPLSAGPGPRVKPGHLRAFRWASSADAGLDGLGAFRTLASDRLPPNSIPTYTACRRGGGRFLVDGRILQDARPLPVWCPSVHAHHSRTLSTGAQP